jgi:hypothetical protein
MKIMILFQIEEDLYLGTYEKTHIKKGEIYSFNE